jgi:hypothetical protein
MRQWSRIGARKRCGRQAQRSGDIIKRDGSKVFGLGELSPVVTGGAKRARPKSLRRFGGCFPKHSRQRGRLALDLILLHPDPGKNVGESAVTFQSRR